MRMAAYLIPAKRGYRGDVHRAPAKEIIKAFKDSIWAILAPVIMFIVVFAGIFTWATDVIGVVDKAAASLVRISPNALVMIILIDLLLLILGMFLDSISRQAIPFIIASVIVLIILSLFPQLSLYLPVKAGLYTP